VRGLPAHVFAGVADGNAAHKHWTRRKLLELLGNEDAAGATAGAAADAEAEAGAGVEAGAGALAGRRVTVWGLTYKPGTDTLRRSSAIELCRWLVAAGARVRAHDPAVAVLPAELAAHVELCSSPLQAAAGAEALVLCTPWPEYLHVPVEELLLALALAHVIDPAGVLRAAMAPHPHVRYMRVGTPLEIRARLGAAAMPVSEARS